MPVTLTVCSLVDTWCDGLSQRVGLGSSPASVSSVVVHRRGAGIVASCEDRSVSEDQALYVRDGDAFVGTICTKGSWHANGQSGGAVLALLGHVLEDIPTLVPMSLSRLTVDIVRPVPLGAPLHIAGKVLREGKKIQLVEFVVRAGDDEHVMARALRLRDLDITRLDAMPRSTTDVRPADLLPPPDALEPVDRYPGVPEFLRMGAELRRTVGPVNGVHGAWVRLRVPVVAGEAIRATSRTVLPMDCVNLIGLGERLSMASAINADVSAHVSRQPRGEWVGLTGNTYFDHGVAHGVSAATMSDFDGVFGVTSTSQLVQPRIDG